MTNTTEDLKESAAQEREPTHADHIVNLLESADALSMLIGILGNYGGKLKYRREKLQETARLLETLVFPPVVQIQVAETERLREALQGLEWACEQLAATRSTAIYTAMIDGGQADALLALDGRRSAARAALTAEHTE